MACTGKCKIQIPLCGDILMGPVIVNIENRPLSNEEITKSKCFWYNSDKSKSARLIKLENEEGSYEGSFNRNDKRSKTILVLKHKSRNKVQLIEAGECHLSKVLPKANLQTNYDNDEIELTYEENRSNLLKAFGSKKGKQFESGLKVKINPQMTVTQMENIASGVDVDLTELATVDSVVDSCMPPCHRDAVHPSQVFILEDFLTECELDSMGDEAFTIYHLMPFSHQESGYSQFFIDTLDRLQHKAKEDRIKILLYIESIMNFMKIRKFNTKQNELIADVCSFSPIIGKKILDEFSENTKHGRIRNRLMDDKIVIHIIILMLILCDNSCNVEELSKYLPKYSVTKLGQMARALSLSTRDKITWFIKIPLPPLKSKYIRRKNNF